MINEPDYSDPAYWASQGITMIEVDLNEEGSIDVAGMKQIVERIQEAVEQIESDAQKDF